MRLEQAVRPPPRRPKNGERSKGVHLVDVPDRLAPVPPPREAATGASVHAAGAGVLKGTAVGFGFGIFAGTTISMRHRK